MTTQFPINQTVDELAARLELDKRRAEIQAMAAGYAFTKSKDDVGLPHEHPRYVKKNCKSCHGRGYQIQYFNGGARIQIGEAEGGRAPHTEIVQRLYQACKCQVARYNRIRSEVEVAASRMLMVRGVLSPKELEDLKTNARKIAAADAISQYQLD